MLEFLWGNKEEKAARLTVKQLQYKTRLSGREKQRLTEARKLSGRLFKRRLGFGTATLAVLLGSIWFIAEHQQPSMVDLPGWLKIEDAKEIGSERVKQAARAAIDWDSRFHCDRDITIARLENPFSKIVSEFIISQEEYAIPGRIEIADGVDARNNVLHAMTHACISQQPILVHPPLKITDGEIMAFSGLSLHIRLDNGQNAYFHHFEEGMAERNASSFSGYTVYNPVYSELGQLTRRNLPESRFPQAHNLVKISDVSGFTRIQLNLTPGTPITGEHMEEMMDRYEEAYRRGFQRIGIQTPVSMTR